MTVINFVASFVLSFVGRKCKWGRESTKFATKLTTKIGERMKIQDFEFPARDKAGRQKNRCRGLLQTAKCAIIYVVAFYD